jgi:tetratricopeptide (TPR) repeat protein
MQPNPAQAQQPTPKDFFEQAKKLLAVGDVFEASKRAGKLRAHFPEEPPILALHGFTLAKLGLHGPAIMDMRASSQLTLRSLEDEDEAENPARPRIVDQYIRLQSEIGRSLAELGEHDDAVDEIQLAIDMDPDRGDAIGAMAEVLASKGDTAEAIKLIEDGLARKLDEIPLLISFAKVLVETKDQDSDRMTSCRDQIAGLVDEVGIGAGVLMALLRGHGMLCDALGEHSSAFQSFRRAAKLRRGGYNAEVHAKMTSRIIGSWTADEIDKLLRPEGKPGAQRVILCGSEHSGVPEVLELLERLPNTVGIGPIESLGMLCATQLNAARGVLRALVPTPQGHRGDQIGKLAAGYSRQCDAAARMGGMRTVDTHPGNTPLVGCVAMALPGVVVINCRRDPMEESLAIYCDEMAGNHPYAGDLISTASYVKDTGRLMDHWTSVLNDERVGGKVINLQYEQVLSDPQAVLRQLADAMSVEMDDDLGAGLESKEATGPGSHVDQYNVAQKQLREFFEV